MMAYNQDKSKLEVTVIAVPDFAPLAYRYALLDSAEKLSGFPNLHLLDESAAIAY